MKVRLETMGKLHCIIFLLVLMISIVIFFGVSFKVKDVFKLTPLTPYNCAA